MPSPSELSLDCKPNSYSMLLKSFVSDHQHHQNQPQKQQHQHHQLQDLLSRLEGERDKIDAFKRELPLCMQLLTNAVETSRQQLQACRSVNEGGPKPILEEFIPLKQSITSDSELDSETANISDHNNKANWMTSAQLWSQGANLIDNHHHHHHETKPLSSNLNNNSNNHIYNSSTSNVVVSLSPKEGGAEVGNNPNLGLELLDSSSNKIQRNNNNNNGGGGGAFLPFSKDRKNSCQNSTHDQLIRARATATARATGENQNLPDLALGASGDETQKSENEEKNICNSATNNQNHTTHCENVNLGVEAGQITTTTTSNNNNNNIISVSTAAGNNSTNQTHRKARRCWSPDLHRRFVNALQMLGGSQVATPKQIRELMKVDGLTNDEVKSHLQKYRLHTRRPSPSPQAPAGAPGPQLVVLGGIWVPPEYATAAAHGGATTLYGPHPTSHAPPHYCAPQVQVHQDFYPPPPLPHHHQLHHHHTALHQQLHMYKTSAHARNSPESDGRGNGDRSESIEDGKSESGSWKAESGGENNGGGDQIQIQRKGNLAAALRQDGDESNGSEITLKF